MTTQNKTDSAQAVSTKTDSAQAVSTKTVLRGSIPTSLYRRFKIHCVNNGINNSEALEIILTKHLASDTPETEERAVELESSHN